MHLKLLKVILKLLPIDTETLETFLIEFTLTYRKIDARFAQKFNQELFLNNYGIGFYGGTMNSKRSH